jgi:hypothetical protein
MKFLQSIDLFGEKVKIYIGQKEVHNSAFGGILTLLMLLSIIIFSWLIGKDLVNKQNPLSYQQSLITERYPLINITSSTFPFGLTVASMDGVLLKNDSIFTLDVSLYNFKTNENNSFYLDKLEKVEMEPCQPRHFPQVTEAEIEAANLNMYSCIKEGSNVNLFGYWTESSFSYIEIRVNMCTGGGCASDQEIKDYIYRTALSLNMLYLQPLIDNTDFSNPIKWAITLNYVYANTQMNKFIEYGLQSNYIQTDAGYFLEDQKSKEFYELKVTVPTDPIDIDPVTKGLILFQFYSNHRYTAYYRKYIKIPEIIASIGGLLKIYLIVFEFINAPFAQINKTSIMINELVNIKRLEGSERLTPISNNSANNVIIHRQRIESTKKIFVASLENSLNLKNNNKLTSLKEKLTNKQKLKFSLCERIGIIFLCFRNSQNRPPKLDLYEKAKLIVSKYFDFINIHKTLEEFQLFKKVSLTDSQFNLFEGLKKLFTNENVTDFNIIENEVEKIYTKQDKSYLDSNLIKLLLKC